MKIRHILTIVFILACITLVLNANQIAYFASGPTQQETTKISKLEKLNTESRSTVSLSRLSDSLALKISENRAIALLKNSLPANSCVEAFTIENAELSRDPFVEKNSDLFLAPASVHKLITAAAVLTTFDEQQTLDTVLFSSKKSSRISKAYVKTSGDPSFVRTLTPTSRRKPNLSPSNVHTFEQFASNTYKAGVRSISSLTIDAKWFELEKIEEGWSDEKGIVGQLSALNVDEGFDLQKELADDPLVNATDVLKKVFADKGVSIGSITFSAIPDEVLASENEISRTSSASISLLVSDMLKTSDNVYAEQLLAAATNESKGVANKETLEELILETFKELKIDSKGYVFKNASGYSSEIRASCSLENEIHKAMLEKGFDLAGESSKAGVDGTLKERADDFSNDVFAKTGTLDNVTALSGKVDGNILFTFIANSQFSNDEGQQLQSNTVSILSEFPYVLPPKFANLKPAVNR